MKYKFKKDDGVAGLTVLLSLITMLFVIGLLVMVFALMGGGLVEATYNAGTGTLTNETIAFTDAGTGTSVVAYTSIALSSVVVVNASGGETIPATNYTVSGGTVTAIGSSAYNGTSVNVSASFSYDADNTATTVISDTTSAISSVTSWFSIFIVIAAMVVLILLTVIIITAIRSSGLMGEGGA